MITQFKIFEKLNVAEIGDYVVMSPLIGNNSTKNLDILNNFLINNIGQIVKYRQENALSINSPWSSDDPDYFGVKYENSPKELANLGYFSPDHIRYFLEGNRIMFKSKNKKDCEVFIMANKYNL